MFISQQLSYGECNCCFSFLFVADANPDDLSEQWNLQTPWHNLDAFYDIGKDPDGNPFTVTVNPATNVLKGTASPVKTRFWWPITGATCSEFWSRRGLSVGVSRVSGTTGYLLEPVFTNNHRQDETTNARKYAFTKKVAKISR